ncbi:MAG: cupin domain-containing protein [Macellibacteroides fermentans]|uniref:cupin domain-containing protein n=1 Tax=Macellibacteroides fermentans TaxID=879969 RepID=UPI003AD38D16
MGVVLYTKTKGFKVNEKIERRLIHTDNLLTAIVDFSGGPANVPDPYHNHPHEQTSYIAEGEIMFFMENEVPVHLKAGDLFSVPSGINHAIQLLTTTARLVDNFNPIREDFL